MRELLRPPSWILALGVVLLLAGCEKPSQGGNSASASAPADRVAFAGIGERGIFDPGIAQDPATGRLWMSYSAIGPSALWPAQNENSVSVRLAYSDDSGRTWIDSTRVLTAFVDVNLPVAPPNNAGTWVNEVAQLAYDPGAVATQRWKLLWHHHLTVNGARLFEHGWIALKMAARPEDLAAAPETKLFAGYLYDAANSTAGGVTGSPVGGPPLIRLDSALSPALAACSMFTEPGMYASGTALYVSLQCERPAEGDRAIVLLRCSSPCNPASAASWSYLGTALRKADAAALGFDSGFGAPGLFAAGASTYLVVSPMQTAGVPWSDYYMGCRVFRFADIDSAALQRSGAQPTVVDSVDGTPGSFNGACSYHASASGSGMLYSEQRPSAADRFQVFMSRKTF